MKKIIAIITILITTLIAVGAVLSWEIKGEQSDITFKIKNAGLEVEGKFTGLKGEIAFDPQNLRQGKITASVDASTIDTGIGIRDRDLKGKHYFEVDTYPRISFQSHEFKKTPQGYLAIGTLTIKDISKEVEIPFTFENLVFKGDFSLNRQDYHVGKRSWLMADEVHIFFEIPVSGK